MCKHGDSCGKLGSYLVKNFAKFCCQLCSVGKYWQTCPGCSHLTFASGQLHCGYHCNTPEVGKWIRIANYPESGS